MAHDTGLHFFSHVPRTPPHTTKGLADDGPWKSQAGKMATRNWQQSGGAETPKFSSAARQLF